MKIEVYGRKMDVSDALEAYAVRKMEKLSKYFGDEPAAQITFSIERGMQTAEISFEVNGMYFRAQERTSDMYASIDGAVASIDRQIQKNKTKLSKRIRQESFAKSISGMTDYHDEEFELVREKVVDMKPMTIEDAILQMNLLGHNFFFFINSDKGGKASVVYRRNAGGYGLLVSEV
ncbi:MAG: ribosome-associated translation inhibitor RaiA [Clostridia bacterium]|nr:ribosome-associated translation inhibitor RaiA [Clostridia bacterium]